MNNSVIDVSPVSLGEADSVRPFPRNPRHRQPGYEQEFDSRTLFYDVFRSGRYVRLSGPPLTSLKLLIEENSFAIGEERAERVSLKDADRTQRSWLESHSAATDLRFQFSGSHRTVQISADESARFAGRRVLYTMSKDNELAWIADWVRFYVSQHGTDSVLLYDNGSAKYSPEELLQAIAAVPGVVSTVVVKWPFKYGPSGGMHQKWDSDFCQYGAFEHARWRFLRDASSVINADIDELVILADGGSIHSRVEKSRAAGVKYRGIWVDSVLSAGGVSEASERTYADFPFINNAMTKCPNKWTVVPSRLPAHSQWKTHAIDGARIPSARDVKYRHFKGMNTGWKYNREPIQFSPEVHERDDEMLRQVKSAFL